MPKARSRFSGRHLLALCTFLVPLGLLAWLGGSELSRRGVEAEQALQREAWQVLRSAVQALEQQLDRQLPEILDASVALLADHGPVATIRLLREQEKIGALLDLVLLDELGDVVWPQLPPSEPGLPLARGPRSRGGDGIVGQRLQLADLLLSRGQFDDAAAVLQDLVTTMTQATTRDGETDRQPSDLDEFEVRARFRLATVWRRLGELDSARAEFEQVRAMTIGRPGRTFRGFDLEWIELGTLAELGLAELGGVADRARLLQTIATGRRDMLADGLLRAICDRLLAGIPPDAPEFGAATVDAVDAQIRQHARAFAADYDLLFKESLRRRSRQSPEPMGPTSQRLHRVLTLGNTTSMLCLRSATPAETERTPRCARVGLRLDLGQLLAPVLEAWFRRDGRFVLAISDPDDVVLAAPPSTVPPEFVPPTEECYSMTLRVYPADAERLMADSAAATRIRAFLVLALFAAAFGGALWLWRSITREAELANLKVDLVSRVSHELKTPLALIRMYGETLGLGRARDASQAAHFGGIIARESERLTNLIQRILDFSRQQAGTLQYAPQRCDVGAVLQALGDAYRPHLESKGATLTTSLADGVIAEVDVAALEGAIINLLENAVKYVREDEPDRHIELTLTADHGMARIDVADRGRGIPAAERRHIFDSFYRASNAGEVRGAGLGLSLVRHFATAHGGTVEALPRVGGGSVFRIALPTLGPES